MSTFFLYITSVLYHYSIISFFFFFFNDTATTEIYTSSHTLSLHDALPISGHWRPHRREGAVEECGHRSEEHTSELQSRELISYAVFCLKKKKKKRRKYCYRSEQATRETRCTGYTP